MRCKSMKIRHSIFNNSKNDFKKNSTDGHRPSVAYRPTYSTTGSSAKTQRGAEMYAIEYEAAKYEYE